MAKLKSMFQPVVKHLDKFGEPSDSDYELIKEFLPIEIPKSDIFVYSIKLCDNLLDREGEFFSLRALEQLKELFVGTTGIFNHEWKSNNQHSRIYKTELITDDSKKNESLEPYRYIVGYAYTINSEKNKQLIEDVGAGILKEVSIGFKHDPPTIVELPDGRKASRIDNIQDVYEWSFVAVPAQRFAGVVKSFNPNGEVVKMDLKEAVAKLKSFSGVDQSVVESISTAIENFQKESANLKSLESRVKALEKEVEEKDIRIKQLEQEIVENTLAHAIEDVLSDFELVSETAAEIARQVAEKEISLAEDGSVVGVEEAKAKLKSDYSFLFKNLDNDGGGCEGDDNGNGEYVYVATKSLSGNAVKRGIDFTKTSSVNTKSAKTNSAVKPRGLYIN